MLLLKELHKRVNNQFKKRVMYFFENTNISGIRFLSERCGIPGKIFWTISIIISLWGMVHIFNLTIERFYSNDISIGIDTTYLHWLNTFPAVSICLVKGSSSTLIGNYLKNENLTNVKNMIKFSRTIHSYLFTTATSLIPFKPQCENLNSTCGVNFQIIEEKFLPKSCNDVITNVIYNGESYNDCETVFKYHKTEMGHCFIANSITDYDYDINKVKLKFTREADFRYLKFTQKESGGFWKNIVCVHSPEDLPYFNTECVPLTSQSMHLTFNLEEIKNEAEVMDVSINHRSCRFPHEKFKHSTFHYSFSTCMSDLRIKSELKTCNCTIPTSPKNYASSFCDVYGMDCIAKADIIEKVKMLHSNPKTACLPSCLEQRISGIGENQIQDKNIPRGTVKIELVNLPIIRYIRQVSKTKLDLVVAIGGVAGLFFGASIINFVEIIYIWFIRKL